jgi:hypothetical protein
VRGALGKGRRLYVAKDACEMQRNTSDATETSALAEVIMMYLWIDRSLAATEGRLFAFTLQLYAQCSCLPAALMLEASLESLDSLIPPVPVGQCADHDSMSASLCTKVQQSINASLRKARWNAER